jgi:hypothetical protein
VRRSLPGLPLGVPGGHGGGEPLAVVGVAVFVVGWAVAQAVVGDGAVAGGAGPGDGAAVAAGVVAVGVSGGVGECCFGGRSFGVVSAAGVEAEGCADLVPAVAGLTGLANVVAGQALGGVLSPAENPAGPARNGRARSSCSPRCRRHRRR